MSTPPEVVGENELAFFFQTNEPIPARPLLAFIWEVERIALTRRYFGPSVLVEITEIQTGTKLVRLTLNQKVGIATAIGTTVMAAVAVAEFGLHIADRIQQPKGRLAETVAAMCLDNGVAECVITTSDTQITIGRDDLPALKTIKDKREKQHAEANASSLSPRLRPNDALSASTLDEARLEEQLALRDEFRDELFSRRDGRIYTLVGYLRPPDADGNTVPSADWEFRSRSGKTYIARGLDPARIGRTGQDLLVIRAETIGRDRGVIILDVKDVFEPEDP